MPFSTSLQKYFHRKSAARVDFGGPEPTYEWRRDMTTEEMVVDVSQDWVLACDVQQGSMQSPCTVSESLDYGARCRQIPALGRACCRFIPLKSDQLALVVGEGSGTGLAAA